MHIALTGASGFIGSFLTRRLHGAGHTVAALVRETSRRDHIGPFVERFVVGEQDDEAAWPRLLERADCVIHNSVDWGPLREPGGFDRHAESNLLGSIRLLGESAPRQFVFVSSIAVYHDMRGRWGGVIDEDHPLRPNSSYGAYKAAVEAFLWGAHFGAGQHTCSIRPCGVYGIDPLLERSHGYDILRQLVRGEPCRTPGGGKWVHVEDVATAIAAVVGNPAAGGRAFNLVDCYARHAEWAKLGAEVLGVDADIDFSSPEHPKNEFSKKAARELGVSLDRGRDGIRTHLRELATVMERAGVLR